LIFIGFVKIHWFGLELTTWVHWSHPTVCIDDLQLLATVIFHLLWAPKWKCNQQHDKNCLTKTFSSFVKHISRTSKPGWGRSLLPNVNVNEHLLLFSCMNVCFDECRALLAVSMFT
jgi:hypothetical protein